MAVHRMCVCLALLVVGVGCAPTIPPAVPSTLGHPEYLYPVLPPALAGAPGASRVDVGWRYLQADDLKNADLEFGVALKLGPQLYPARVGQGYVAMARRDYDRALAAFDEALKADGRYVPALVGRGQSLLAVDRSDQALVAFESALALDPSLTDLARRVEVLRFRRLQEVIDVARAATAAGRVDDARRAYERALADSPQSAFLHREVGLLEKGAGNTDSALAHLRRAADLDPSDVASFVAIAELLEARGDAAGAEAAYRQAAELEPGVNLTAKIAEAAKRARESRLPPEFQAAVNASQITRADLAALIGVRLEELIRRAPVRQVVMTDTQGSWAEPWITQVAAAGIMEPFENHTFQPLTRLRRGDLATVASHLLALVAAEDPVVRERLTARRVVADITPGHVQYDAVMAAVAAGVMPLVDGDRFQVSRQVSGQEAVEVIDRVGALAATILGAARR